MNNLFEISNLKCAYPPDKKKVVLQIEKLYIPFGKIVCILGKSGSGKSTLIETLGLMNDTIAAGDVKFNSADEVHEFDQSTWESPAKLAEIRRQHFSFIFQNDYLMPDYSIKQNIALGSLIKEVAMTSGELQMEVEKICKKLTLPPEIFLQKPNETAGGQKQRISFARAVLKDYSVLFGDEPTGNLDEVNSRALMDVLRESIYKKTNRSAILVSHNISLSVDYADKIVLLSPLINPPINTNIEQTKEMTNNSKNLGSEILPENIFNRDDSSLLWNNERGDSFDAISLKQHILHFFQQQLVQ